jgi:alcohol dehydrogenase
VSSDAGYGMVRVTNGPNGRPSAPTDTQGEAYRVRAMLGSSRPRPRGWLRHYAGLLTPDAAAATPVLLERDRLQRLGRLGATLGDRAGQRVRRTRPRMRALQVAPGARMSWRDVPAPAPPGPDGAVVRPIACSTCDLDCGIALGAGPFPLPLHLGHECVAEVLTVGERVRTVKPGERVIVPFQINCGACPDCRAGRTGSCTGVPPTSMYGMGLIGGLWGGAFADQLAVPFADAMLVALPAGIDPAAAVSVADNVCDAYRHIAPHLPALLAEDSAAEVLIVAALHRSTPFGSSAPLYAGLIARAFGARNVTLVDARASVRAHAERLGLQALRPRELRRRGPAPLVVDATVDGLGVALAHTAADGICSSLGGFHRSASVPLVQMYVRNATLHIGRTHARQLIPKVLELMLDGRLHPEHVTTSVGALDDAPRILREQFLGGGVKTVLMA